MKRIWVALFALMLVSALFAMGMAEGLEIETDDYEEETNTYYQDFEDEDFEEEYEEEDEFLIGGDMQVQSVATGYANFVWDGDEPDGECNVSTSGAQTLSDPADFVIENGVLVSYVGIGGDVVIPDGVTCIGDNAFSGCSSLTSVWIPDGVTSIEKGAFYGCTGLTSIVIPDSVNTIASATRKTGTTYGGAFEGCTGLTSMTLGKNVTSIGRYAFKDCTNLTNLHIRTSYYKGFRGKQYLTNVTLADTVERIGQGAFSGCTNLKSIVIPNSVSRIDSEAFQNCSQLTSIIIPDTVNSFGIMIEYDGDGEE